MKFHDSAPTRIFKYGVYRIASGADEVDQQFRLAHQYRNRLVEIEREKRRACLDVLMADPRYRELHEKVAAAQEQIDELREQAAKLNQEERRRTERGTIKQAISELYRQQRAWKREMKAIWKVQQTDPRMLDVFARFDREKKAARAQCGCYHSTYVTVEAEAAASAASVPYDEMPRFVRWDESRRLAVQLVNGEPTEKILECDDTRIRLELPGLERERVEARNGRVLWRNRSRLAILWFRVRSQDRKPVWARIEFVYHRPLPENCLVKWVYLLRRRVGRKPKLELLFSLARPGASWDKPDRAASGIVAVDFGWRQKDERIRAGYWVGDDGDEGEILLRPDLIDLEERTYSLRSIRDNLFNAQRDALAEWIGRFRDRLPESLTALAQHIRQWRSHSRLIVWYYRWRAWAAEFGSGMPREFREMDKALQHWVKKEQHLWDWEANLRDQLSAYRRDAFSKAAALLRRRYRTLVITDLDLRKLARRPAPEEQPDPAQARAHRHQVATGILREKIKQAFGDDVIVLKHELANARHHACGHEGEWPDRRRLYQHCDACGQDFDQDQNAARNLLEHAAGSLAIRSSSG